MAAQDSSALLLKWAVVACAVLFAGLGVFLAPLHPSVVALQFTYSPEAFAAVLQTWGPDGVVRFRQHLTVDGLLLLSYGSAGYLAAGRTRLFASLTHYVRLAFWALLLPLAAVFDAGENLLHWWLTGADVLNGTVTLPSMTYFAAGLCASAKWLGIALYAAGAFAAQTVSRA
jgi:hypothetical protein